MMELVDHHKIFLEKEHLAPIINKLVENNDLVKVGSDNDNQCQMTVATFVEMCWEIFSGNGSSTNIANDNRRSPTTMDLAMSDSGQFSASPLSVVQKCIRKYRQVIRRYYDLKCVSFDKYLKQSDLNTARETALVEAMKFFDQIRPNEMPAAEQESLKQHIKQQIAQEYRLVQAVNEHKKCRFLSRVLSEIEKNLKETLGNRYSFLFTGESSHDLTSGSTESCTKLRFCDPPKLEQFTEESVKKAILELNEYLQISHEQQRSINSSPGNSTASSFDLQTPEAEGRDRLTKIQNDLLHRNQQTLQKAHTFLHSHLEDSAADCHVGIEKALDAEPFLSKQHIHDNLVAPKKNKYAEEFCTRVVFTDDNEDFQNEFQNQLNARINKVVEGVMATTKMKKQRLMRRFEDDVKNELHELVCKLGKRHGIEERQMTRLNMDLMETARRSLNKIQESVGVRTTKWICTPINTTLSPPCSPQFTLPNGPGGFSIQVTYTGIRVGLLQNHSPHVLQYINSSDGVDTVTSKIPLVAGLTYGSPGEFVFGHQVEERKNHGCLRCSWDLGKMLYEKQHCLSSGHQVRNPKEQVRFGDITFRPTFEFLLGAILKECKRFCLKSIHSSGGENGKDMVPLFGKCIISVPPRLLPFQRQQVKDAARIAGFEDANVRIFDESSCVAYHRDPIEKVFESPKSPEDNVSDELLVISQYTDHLQQMKFDFVQYKRGAKRITMEHYIDEEVIMRLHLRYCKNCIPNSPRVMMSPHSSAPSTSKPAHYCEAFKKLQGRTSMEEFLMSVLQEALAHPHNSKVSHVLLNCENPDWEKILQSKLPLVLPNITIKLGDGMRSCGEYGVIHGLIQMGRGALWDIRIGKLHTRSGTIWIREMNGSLSRKLGGYQVNERQDTASIMEAQLLSNDSQVSAHFGVYELNTSQEEVAWGTLKILREIPQGQAIVPKFVVTDEGNFKLMKVELHQLKQAQQSQSLSTLEHAKDFTWAVGNLSKGQLKECTEKVGKLLMGGRSPRSSPATKNKPISTPSAGPSSSQAKDMQGSPTASANGECERGRPVKRPALLPTPCLEPVEKKVRV